MVQGWSKAPSETLLKGNLPSGASVTTSFPKIKGPGGGRRGLGFEAHAVSCTDWARSRRCETEDVKSCPWMFPRNENRNEGMFAFPPSRKPERGYIRQNHPFTKPLFCLPVTHGWRLFRGFKKGLADRGGWRKEILPYHRFRPFFLHPFSYAPPYE